MTLWVKAAVKWSRSPPLLSHTPFLRVCLYRMTPDPSPWHMCEMAPSISDASAGARTSDAHKQTQRDEQEGRVSPPGSSWPTTPTLTGFTHARKMMNCPRRAVFPYSTPAQQRTTAATNTGVCVHAFEYTHKVVSEAHF